MAKSRFATEKCQTAAVQLRSTDILPEKALGNFGPRLFDHQLHQQPAEAVPLQIGAHENGVFSDAIFGIGMDAHDTEHGRNKFI
jgi:hypothetical protein